MNIRPLLVSATFAAFLGAASPSLAQFHEHINAGAQTPSAGSQLMLDDAEAFLAESGYVWPLSFEPDGYFPDAYATTGLTFTSLPATVFYGGPQGPHAAVGANLQMQIVSVDGPNGGSFGFWEQGDYFFNTTPTVSFATASNESTPGAGLYTFPLTEAYPADPYGHIHDRAYSVTAPGIYTIGLRLIDAAGIHLPGSVFYLRFGTPGAGTAFQSWMSVFGLAQDGETDDPDRDGMSNLEEYLWNCRPDLADLAQRPVSIGIPSGSPGVLRVTYQPVAARLLDVSVVVETATTLGPSTTWTPVDPGLIVELADGDRQVDIPISGSRLWARLRLIHTEMTFPAD